MKLVTKELDKPSKSYEQKTKISINLAEIIANFTNLDSVDSVDTVKICEIRYDFGQIYANFSFLLIALRGFIQFFGNKSQNNSYTFV